MSNRPEFGNEALIPKRRHLKVVTEETKPQKVEVTGPPCKFLVLQAEGIIPQKLAVMRSSRCQHVALANGWCKEHQHAQTGMDLGERLGYPSIEISAAFVMIGAGKWQWLAYFERARDPGLATVMAYLEKQKA